MKSEYVQTMEGQCQSGNDFVASFAQFCSCDLLTMIGLSLVAFSLLACDLFVSVHC